jgi:hypothetical protein
MALVAADEMAMMAPAVARYAARAAPYLNRMAQAAAYGDAAYDLWRGSRSARARLGTYGRRVRSGIKTLRRYSKKKGKRTIVKPNPKLTKLRTRRRGYDRGGVLDLARVRFRRPGRPRRVGKAVVLTKDQSGQLTCDASQGSNSGWIGFQHHDSYDALIRAAVEGLAQAILAVMKIYPDGQTDPFVIDGVRLGDTPILKIKWQNVDPNSGDLINVDQSISLVSGGNADTFIKLCNFMQVDFKTNVEAGVYPTSFDLTCSQVGEPTVYLHRDVDISNATMRLLITQRVDLQNQSKAATTGTAGHEDVASRLNIHSQPLRGKMYVFKHAKADVHDNLHKEHGYLDFFEDTLLDNGVGQYKGLKTVPVIPPVGGYSHYLINHPPPGRNIFKNLVSEGNVTLGAGEVKKFTTTFKFKGTLRTFVQKLNTIPRLVNNTYWNGSRKPFGGITWFCIERSIKHGDADMEVAFNREIKVYSYVQIRHQRHQLRRTEDP